ncbi:glycosyltransferase family 2 protein [Hyphococcus luteus]|uniref:Glycosyl transferase n=1 Tax=Hyphococcus luteus TaxID=2058213 RepID=A0A2S7K470_9PROT|nr:glycosyltransferase family 2 protein [Marinicaulis flavus]PQA87303.1 glycosyl transferase [Marinicaulis flavus]
MTLLVYLLLTPLVLAGLAFSIFLALEIAAALSARDEERADAPAPPFVVVIPAHNEAGTIAPVLENVRGCVREGDRILVVADNCADQTADIARAAGVDVIERNDPSRRGKGYALQFALDHLRRAPPAIVVFSDADCQFAPGALQRVAAAAQASGRPAQALYLMTAPAGAGPRLQASEFAWAFMNNARMRGLQRLFNVTRFTGAGFAAPWPALADLQLASGEIVEDLALTMALIRKGAPPMLVADALVVSEFPTDDAALTRQAARWSIGSMRYSARAGLAALLEGVFKGRPSQIGAAVDLMVPPLTVFAAALTMLVLFGFLAGLFVGAWMLFALALCALVIAAAAVVAGWRRYGRDALPPESLGGLFALLASKASVFGSHGRKSAKSWTPTRGDSGGENG